MALDSTHPLYDEHVAAWQTYRDFYEGEVAVKKKTVEHLPATRAMILDGMSPKELGYEIYLGYLSKAVFPENYFEAVENNLGRLFFKPPVFDLPTQMKYMELSCTRSGESLLHFLRYLYKEILSVGRGGIYIDIETTAAGAHFVLEFYRAEAIRNWNNNEGLGDLSLVTLDESGYKLNEANLTWEPEKRTRILKLVDGKFATHLFTQGNDYTYVETLLEPPLHFGKTLTRIPFVFANSTHTNPEPEKSPLSGLASVVASIYKGEADYRQNLHLQGQDTLVMIGQRTQGLDNGDDQPVRTGAGSFIGVDIGGDAKYIGVNAAGLSEQRECLAADYKRAEIQSGKLTNTGKDSESGSSLNVRVNSQTISLDQIARTGAEALQKALRICAEWAGADPSKVVVTPNLEFVEFALAGKDLVDLVNARRLGAPLSYESIHSLQVERGLTKLTFEEELDKIKEENVKMDVNTGDDQTKEKMLGE